MQPPAELDVSLLFPLMVEVAWATIAAPDPSLELPLHEKASFSRPGYQTAKQRCVVCFHPAPRRHHIVLLDTLAAGCKYLSLSQIKNGQAFLSCGSLLLRAWHLGFSWAGSFFG